ncbi:unnamed protein product, partial [marine sediment metagenome]
AGSHDSPTRNYVNKFLDNFLKELTALGKINILDIGCGSGYIREILAGYSFSGDYTGVDIQKHKDFEKYNLKNFSSVFIKSRIEDFKTNKKFDLIISNFVLEHVEDDFDVISKCDELIKRGGIQIHILPSFWSLFLYLWHGYRQYNPKRLKKLFSYRDFEVFRLGGFFSFKLHLFFITIPVLIFHNDKLRNKSFYPGLVRMSSKLDKVLTFLSTFYVVVVKN